MDPYMQNVTFQPCFVNDNVNYISLGMQLLWNYVKLKFVINTHILKFGQIFDDRI